MTTATVQTAPRTPASRPNLVSVGTIVWLSSELMFFAALFAMYFTVRSVTKGSSLPWPGAHLNLALGSAMASIGLTIPAVALASVWLSGPLVLGLSAIHMVLLALTVVVASLTVVPGRATPLQGGVHLVLFAAYLELAVNP